MPFFKNFDPNSFNLPAAEIIDEVKSTLAKQSTAIIQAPPGAGKSTLLPLCLVSEDWLQGKKILMLEPRRLATKSIARRMAEMTNTALGQEIGYRIRFEQMVSAATKIEVITEGILTRMIHSDNALEEIGLVIFDEFHERNLHSEVGLALCREIQEVLRPDLRVLLMSATIDTVSLSKLIEAKVLQSEGRQYPVEIHHLGEIDAYDIGSDTARNIISIANQTSGDILVFLPGQGEIKSAEKILRSRFPDYAIVPLYGQLPYSAQQKAIFPDPQHRRKIVLSTDIAETSLTIEGVKVVIDSGYAKSSKYDPKSGLSRLVLHRISADSADQRSGRAGRLTAGQSYRLWTKATQQNLIPYRPAELQEADLTPMVLDMSAWGKEDIENMAWLTPPPKKSLASARQTLESLEATKDGKLTEHGKSIHRLPCHPRIAHLLVEAEKLDAVALATDLAAILEERDPLPKEAGVDINLRIEALRRYRKSGVAIPRIKRIDQVAGIYRKMMGIKEENDPFDPWQTGLLLAYAYPERIASARPGNNAQFQLANGSIAQIGHKDDLSYESWLAVAHVDAREGLGKIWLAAPINPKDLMPMLKSNEIVRWDRKNGGLIAENEMRIGAIILGKRPLQNVSVAQKQEALLAALSAEGEFMLNWDESTTQLMYRINSLRIWNPEENWPDWSKQKLLDSLQDWLLPYLNDVRKNEDLLKLNLADILFHSLDFIQQESLNRLAPSKLTVPSSSQVSIEYHEDGETPLLSVRLQELFGLTETPTVNQGKVKLLIQLLSPGFKPVQLTQDLKSFWSNGYFEVRKELKRRYPKHEWPENPLSATAVSGVRRKNQ